MVATTKATFGLPVDAVDYLRSEANKRGVSMADVLRQAIATDRFIRTKSEAGADVLLAESGKPTTRIVFPT